MNPELTIEPVTVVYLIQALTTAYLTTERERHSMKWCENKLVGPLRDKLAPPVTIPMLETAITDARQIASFILEKHCSACRGCPLGR